MAWSQDAIRLYEQDLLQKADMLAIGLKGLRSAHPKTRDHTGAKKFSDIKVLREEPAVVADKADEIKAQYTRYFKV